MNAQPKAIQPPRLMLPLSMLVLGVVVGAWAFGSSDEAADGDLGTLADHPEAGVRPPPGPAAMAMADMQAQWQDLADRLRRESQARQRLAAEVAELHGRVEALSITLADLENVPADAVPSAVPQAADTTLTAAGLVAVGLSEAQAAEIVRRQAAWEMRRLELQDEARRGGWLFTDRYYDAVRELEGGADDLRAELGEEVYDRYLFASGRPNRVMVASVIDGSPAQQAGLEPGDVILSYAGARQFAWSTLRSATSEGSRGEYVAVRVRRDGRDTEVWVPRGPLGVRLEMVRVDPEG